MANMTYMPHCPTIQGFFPASIGIGPFGREMAIENAQGFFKVSVGCGLTDAMAMTNGGFPDR